MGGEGGGVLADWIVDLGEDNGHIAQTHLGARRGAAHRRDHLLRRAVPARAAERRRRAAGAGADADCRATSTCVIASELMEAGRAVQRGLVTPDRTTLIASTHRVYCDRREVGHGRRPWPTARLLAAARSGRAALRALRHGRGRRAHRQRHQRGAVRRAGRRRRAAVRPRGQFEATIARGGVGVAASLKAFDAGVRGAPSAAAARRWQRRRRAAHRARTARSMRTRRSTRCCERAARATFPDRRAARCSPKACAAWSTTRTRPTPRSTSTASRAIAHAPADDELLGRRPRAIWRCGCRYEDTIRVADLKTRATRFERVRAARCKRRRATRCSRSTSSCTRACRRSAETLPAGWAAGCCAPARRGASSSASRSRAASSRPARCAAS